VQFLLVLSLPRELGNVDAVKLKMKAVTIVDMITVDVAEWPHILESP